jgi:glycosyltransferase involved in cell wall biosynthesis
MVCLEAQAAGVPVIAGRSGGMPDALRDGVSGVLVDPTDVDALAAAIVRLLGDPASRSAMAEAALEHARASSWHESARRMLEALGLEGA